MAFSLNINSLFSRSVREAIGERTLKTNPLQNVLVNGKNAVRVAIGGSFNGFLVGLAFSTIPSLTWGLSGLWAMFTSASLELYYFDWNQPDDQIDQAAKQQWQQYGSLLGGLSGNAFGYFACGVVPATSMAVFNRDLAVYVLREVGEEAFEELTSQFSYALQQTVRNLARQSFGWLYKGARRWLKDPNNPVGDLIFGGRAAEVREKWGAANAPSWSFAQEVDEKVEKIPSQFWQNFTEEFIEEAIDACIEAGYVVANAAESFYARQRMSEVFSKEKSRVIEVTPNKDNDREKLILAGPESDIRGQLPAVLAHHQLIESRDIGQLIGQQLDDYVRAKPLEGLRLVFKMFNFKSPPYSRRGTQRLVEVTVTVPNVDRSKIDWDKLRLACGGANGYLWGRFRSRVELEDGHTMSCYGGTPDEAEDRVRAFMALSESAMRTISGIEEKKEGVRLTNSKLYKETTRVYPGYVTIINRERTLRNDLGNRSLDGNYIDKEARIDLWRGTKPPDFEEKIIELLRRAT